MGGEYLTGIGGSVAYSATTRRAIVKRRRAWNSPYQRGLEML